MIISLGLGSLVTHMDWIVFSWILKGNTLCIHIFIFVPCSPLSFSVLYTLTPLNSWDLNFRQSCGSIWVLLYCSLVWKFFKALSWSNHRAQLVCFLVSQGSLPTNVFKIIVSHVSLIFFFSGEKLNPICVTLSCRPCFESVVCLLICLLHQNKWGHWYML